MAKKKKISIPKSAIKKLPKKDPSTVQSIIFGNKWKLKDAKKWLKVNSYVPIEKVHITKKIGNKAGGSMKFTILDAKDCGKLGFKRTNQGISFIICTPVKKVKEKKD